MEAQLVSKTRYLAYNLVNTAPSSFVEIQKHGIRIVVKQSGFIGQFKFQQLLLSLVSSVALLAVAKTVVDFLAFNVLPLKYIYGQYRTINVSA